MAIERMLSDDEFYNTWSKNGDGIFANIGNVSIDIMDAIEYHIGIGEEKDFIRHRVSSIYEVYSMWN